MPSKLFKTALLIAQLLITTAASGITLVDTGSPALSANGAVSLDRSQWMGVRFVLDNSYQITDIKSYFYAPTNNPGTLTVVLYNEISGVPGAALYSKEFTIQSSYTKDWHSVSELDWLVSSGNYWLTYEVREGQTFSGALEFPAPTPLVTAIKNDFGYSDWTVLNGLGFGFGLFVAGDPVSSVPEPETLALLGLGMLAFAGRRRRIGSAYS